MPNLNDVTNELSYLLDPVQFIIDENMRTVTIPENGVIAGVVGDKNVNHINFQMPRMYNGFDMSLFDIRVVYVNAKDEKNYYPVTDSTILGDQIRFTWLVDSDVTKAQGVVHFTVKMTRSRDGQPVQIFNTVPHQVYVLDGIDVDEWTPTEEKISAEEFRRIKKLFTDWLVDNKVDATDDESFESLISKVQEIKSGKESFAEPSLDILYDDSYLKYSIIGHTVFCKAVIHLKNSIAAYTNKKIFSGLPLAGTVVRLSDYGCDAKTVQTTTKYGTFWLRILENGDLLMHARYNSIPATRIDIFFEYPIAERIDRVFTFKTPLLPPSTADTVLLNIIQNKEITNISGFWKFKTFSSAGTFFICSGLPKPKNGKDIYRSLSNDSTVSPAEARITSNGDLYVTCNKNGISGGITYESEWNDTTAESVLTQNLNMWDCTIPDKFTIAYNDNINSITLDASDYIEKIRQKIAVMKGKDYVFSFKISSSSAITNKNVADYMLFSVYISKLYETFTKYCEETSDVISVIDVVLDGSGKYTEYQINCTAHENDVWNVVFDFSNLQNGRIYSGIKIKDISFTEINMK